MTIELIIDKPIATIVINRPELLNRMGDNVIVFDFIREIVASHRAGVKGEDRLHIGRSGDFPLDSVPTSVRMAPRGETP